MASRAIVAAPVDAPSDAELLERWRAGDRGAAEALTRRHYGSVLRYFELNASAAAEDLAQTTFMACVERAAEVRDADAFRAYLMGIARRQLALHLRDLSRNAKYGDFDDGPQRTQMSTLLARSREQFLVLRALATLPRRPQLLLILFYWDRMRTPQLAEAFGIPQSTIRTQLQRARLRLRQRMEELAGVGAVRVDDDEQWLPELLTSVLSDQGPLGVGAAVGRS
jgi:RNA polymerase sigma-70 factor (ECF subfamily)